MSFSNKQEKQQEPKSQSKQQRKWAKRRGQLEGMLFYLRGLPRSDEQMKLEQPVRVVLEELLIQARVMSEGSEAEKQLLCHERFERDFELEHEVAIRSFFDLLEFLDDPVTV